MGNRRTDGVTEADDRRLHAAEADSSSSARRPGARPTRAAIDKVGAQLVEALGHFGVEAKVVGSGQRPARHPLRAAPGARDQDVEGLEHARRPRLRARRRRRPHPRADPRQARRRASRCRTRSARWSTSATSRRTRPRAGRRSRSGSARTSTASAIGIDLAEPAARARRGHDRLGQVGLRQRDALPRS